jgi:hypothetical protein
MVSSKRTKVTRRDELALMRKFPLGQEDILMIGKGKQKNNPLAIVLLGFMTRPRIVTKVLLCNTLIICIS